MALLRGLLPQGAARLWRGGIYRHRTVSYHARATERRHLRTHHRRRGACLAWGGCGSNSETRGAYVAAHPTPILSGCSSVAVSGDYRFRDSAVRFQNGAVPVIWCLDSMIDKPGPARKPAGNATGGTYSTGTAAKGTPRPPTVYLRRGELFAGAMLLQPLKFRDLKLI